MKCERTWSRTSSSGKIPPRECAARGCFNSTREGKPYCSDHVKQHPYAQKVLAELARQEDEERKVRRVGARAVDVGGLTTSSGERGEFSLSVPAGESYVLNISRPGYAEFSRRLQAPTRGRTFTLVEAFAQSIDPFSDSVVQDERKKWRDAIFIDPRGERRRYQRRGGRVWIAANTLVDSQGRPPRPSAGPFTAYIATIDPVTETMLGDSRSPVGVKGG